MRQNGFLPEIRHRRVIRASSTAACLLLCSLLLVACGTRVQAIGAGAAAPAVGPSITSTDGWASAGQITPTPEALAAAPAATPAPENQATDEPPSGSGPAPQADATASAAVPQTDYQPVSFAGTVENLPNSGDWTGIWQVSGRAVHVSSSTSIDQHNGPVGQGAQVAVEGWQRPDGEVDAGWILVARPASTQPAGALTPGPANGPSVPDNNQPSPDNTQAAPNGTGQSSNGAPANVTPPRPVEFRGNVDQMPGSGLVGTWRIAGHTVNVGAGTRVQQKQGGLRQGAFVQVMGWLQPDGSINAAMLQTKRVPPGQARGRANAPGQNRKLNQGQNGDQGQGNGNGQGNDQGSGDDENQATGNWYTEWQGTVNRLPANGYVGNWDVDGQQVVVGPQCEIRTDQGGIVPGTYVDIQGWFDADGTFHATRIQRAGANAGFLNGKRPQAGEGDRNAPPGKGRGNGNGNDKGNGKGKGSGG